MPEHKKNVRQIRTFCEFTSRFLRYEYNVQGPLLHGGPLRHTIIDGIDCVLRLLHGNLLRFLQRVSLSNSKTAHLLHDQKRNQQGNKQKYNQYQAGASSVRVHSYTPFVTKC